MLKYGIALVPPYTHNCALNTRASQSTFVEALLRMRDNVVNVDFALSHLAKRFCKKKHSKIVLKTSSNMTVVGGL